MSTPLHSVRDVMQTKFVSFTPNMDIERAVRTLLSKRLMGAPVVDGGRLVGVLAEKDCFEVYARRTFGLDNDLGGKVADFMTSEVVTVSADTDLATAVGTFQRSYYRGVPVVDGERVVGLLSRRDLLAALYDMRPGPRRISYPDYDRPNALANAGRT